MKSLRRKSPPRKFLPIPKDIGDYIACSKESSTGLVWKVNQGRAKKGQEAGTPDGKGYLQVKFKYHKYRNHRIVYFLNTGVDPEEKQVDHIDGDISNNKIYNLRLATNSQNQFNTGKRKDNTSGVVGVYWFAQHKKWASSIRKNKLSVFLGLFDDKNKAIAVRIAAEKDPRFIHLEYRKSRSYENNISSEMLEWAKQYLEDRIERLGWDI